MASLFAELDGEVLVFDGVISENWEFPGTVVDHPVEDYAFVTDHRQRKPNTISVRAVLTGTPLLNLGDAQILDFTGLLSEGPQRYRRARKFLEEYAPKSLFAYSSVRMGVVENLMIESFSFDVDKQDRIEFSIDLKEVVFGRTELVELPPIQQPRAQPPVVCGPQPGEQILSTQEAATAPSSEIDLQERRARTALNRLTGASINQDVRAALGDAAADALKALSVGN